MNHEKRSGDEVEHGHRDWIIWTSALEDYSNNHGLFFFSFFSLGEMANHWQMLSREKDPTSVWDMLILEECVL